MNKVCGIYKITSPTNKVYIGQSINIHGRFGKYKNLNCKEQTKLHRSLVKYGHENHIFEIIHVCTQDELNHLEIYYIELFNSFNSSHGLNLHTGGDCHKTSDETKKKLSLALKGRKLKPRSKEHSHKISLAAKVRCNTPEFKKMASDRSKGKLPWNTGLTQSKETKDKISEKRSRKTILKHGAVNYQCTGCNIFYPADNFYISKRSPTLLTPKCKPCERECSKARKKRKFTQLNKPTTND